MLERELRSWGYLKSLHNRELGSYPQASKYILGEVISILGCFFLGFVRINGLFHLGSSSRDLVIWTHLGDLFRV